MNILLTAIFFYYIISYKLYGVKKVNQRKFNDICDRYNDNLKERDSIGVLNEKTLHAVLKLYMDDDAKNFQEKKIGSFYADLFNGEEICEIQTRDLGKLCKKLEFFLEYYPVTVVHPIAAIKHISWIDPKSGEISKPRKSPLKQGFAHSVRELYRIREHISHPNLHIKLLLLEVHDYKLKNGYGKDRKKRAHRYERFPIGLIDELDLDTPNDYFKIFPRLEGEFCVDEYSKLTGLDKSKARMAINLMIRLGLAELCGKDKRKYVYRFK